MTTEQLATYFDFLDTWRDGGWSEIEAAYPEFIEQVNGK